MHIQLIAKLHYIIYLLCMCCIYHRLILDTPQTQLFTVPTCTAHDLLLLLLNCIPRLFILRMLLMVIYCLSLTAHGYFDFGNLNLEEEKKRKENKEKTGRGREDSKMPFWPISLCTVLFFLSIFRSCIPLDLYHSVTRPPPPSPPPPFILTFKVDLALKPTI